MGDPKHHGSAMATHAPHGLPRDTWSPASQREAQALTKDPQSRGSRIGPSDLFSNKHLRANLNKHFKAHIVQEENSLGVFYKN